MSDELWWRKPPTDPATLTWDDIAEALAKERERQVAQMEHELEHGRVAGLVNQRQFNQLVADGVIDTQGKLL